MIPLFPPLHNLLRRLFAVLELIDKAYTAVCPEPNLLSRHKIACIGL